MERQKCFISLLNHHNPLLTGCVPLLDTAQLPSESKGTQPPSCPVPHLFFTWYLPFTIETTKKPAPQRGEVTERNLGFSDSKTTPC